MTAFFLLTDSFFIVGSFPCCYLHTRAHVMATFLLNSLSATTTTTRGVHFASGGSRRRRVVSRSSSSQNSSSKSSTFFTERDDFDGSSTTITSRDDEQKQQRRQFLPPKEVLQSIYVPESLAEIRAYVRWEEFGKPEETTAEWQASEYKNAILDLKLDLLSGMTLNDIRRRYGVEPVDGDDDELPMFTMDEELEKRMKLAEAMTRVEKVGKMSLVEEDSASPVRYGDAMVDSSSSSVVDEFIKPLPTSPLSSSVIDHVVSAEEMTEEEREMMEEEATVVDRAALSIEYEAEDEEEEERAVLTEGEEDFLQELQASTTFDADDFLPMTEEEKKKKSEEEKKNFVLAEDEEEKVEEEKKRQKAIASELVLNLKVEVDKYKQSAESLKTQMLEATEKAEKASSEFDSMKEQRNRLARELSELELETAAKDDEIKELNEFLVSSEKDFEQSKMEELQSLRESLEQMKEEKKAAEVLARAYKQDFVQERELNAKFREEKNQMMEEKTKSERELRAAANESEMKLSAAMRENAELKKIWDSDRKVIEILTKKLDEMSEKPGLGAAIVNTYSTVKTVIPKYSSVIANTTMNTTKGVVSKTTDISGKFFSAVKTKLEKIKEDELALMDEEEDDDEFEDSDVRTGIFL